MLHLLRRFEQHRAGHAAFGLGVCFVLGACGTLLDIGPLSEREESTEADAASTEASGSDVPVGQDVLRLDLSFGEAGTVSLPLEQARALVLDGQDGVFVSGTVRPDPQLDYRSAGVVHVDGQGQIDRSFAEGGLFQHAQRLYEEFQAIDRDERGLTVVGKTRNSLSEEPNLLVVRLSERGVPNASFGEGGVALISSMRSGDTLQRRGDRWWVGGLCGFDACLQEIDSVGRPTTRRYAFQLGDAPPTSNSLVATPRALIAATQTSTFSGVFVASEDGFTASYALASGGSSVVLPDAEGRVLAASLVASTGTLLLQRFLANGDPDPSFHNGTPLTTQLPRTGLAFAGVLGGASVSRGFLLSGTFTETGIFSTTIFHITPEGALDTNFGNGGIFSVGTAVFSRPILQDSRGRILVTGFTAARRSFLRRYTW